MGIKLPVPSIKQSYLNVTGSVSILSSLLPTLGYFQVLNMTVGLFIHENLNAAMRSSSSIPVDGCLALSF